MFLIQVNCSFFVLFHNIFLYFIILTIIIFVHCNYTIICKRNNLKVPFERKNEEEEEKKMNIMVTETVLKGTLDTFFRFEKDKVKNFFFLFKHAKTLFFLLLLLPFKLLNKLYY